jgi:hypothetical protein
MLTRTSAADYMKDSIFMTAVDTGWINDENPLGQAVNIAKLHNFQTPLDEIDAAARCLDPVFAPLIQLAANGNDDRNVHFPWGYFIKDYAKTEW